MSDKLLEVRNLKTYFKVEAGTVKAVDDVSFKIDEGETVCLVGESGCGKSITSMSIMGLISGNGKIEGGEILYKGQDLLKLSNNDMCNIRGKEIGMVFQEPMIS